MAVLWRLLLNFAKSYKVAIIILIRTALLSSATSADRLARVSSGQFNTRGEQAMATSVRVES